MSLNELRDEIHAVANEKGWWTYFREGDGRRPLEIHALIHSEISEATECVRNNEPSFWPYPRNLGDKPEGEAVELMDAVIRILDYFGERGWDADEIYRVKMEYNKTRPYRHGGKAK